MARALVMGTEEKAKIAALRKFAEENRISREQITQVVTGARAPVGDDPNYVISIPVGYTVVYSIDDLPDFGWTRRLSISVDRQGKLPSIPAFDMLLQEFGFVDGVGNLDFIDVQPAGENHHAIIAAHIIDRHHADELETDGKLPPKDDQAERIKPYTFPTDLERKQFEFGESRTATIESVDEKTNTVVATDSMNEGHVIVGHPLPLPKAGEQGVITFTRGGRMGGYWKFTR